MKVEILLSMVFMLLIDMNTEHGSREAVFKFQFWTSMNYLMPFPLRMQCQTICAYVTVALFICRSGPFYAHCCRCMEVI